MSTSQLQVVSTGAAFLIMFLSGVWLNSTGKPYGTLVFAIHKLIGVGIGIFLFMLVRQAHQTISLGPVEIIAVAVTVLFFAATVTTGSLLSLPNRSMPDIVSTLNKILPYFTVLTTAVTFFILLKR
jgi:hypothetical protein